MCEQWLQSRQSLALEDQGLYIRTTDVSSSTAALVTNILQGKNTYEESESLPLLVSIAWNRDEDTIGSHPINIHFTLNTRHNL